MTTAQAAAGSGRVSVRKTTWLAWSLCAVSLALMAFSILLIVLSRSARFPSSPTEWTAASSAEQIAIVVGSLGAPILGALIAAHRPGNRYGWLWCGIGLASAVNSAAAAYAVYALLVAPDGLPGGLATAWLASCVTWITQGLWPFAFLLFPDGRLPSPWWWPVGWALGLAVAWLTLASALGPGPLESFPFWTNPVMSSAVIPGPIAATFGDWSWSIYLLSLIFIGPAAVVFRFWRARGQQRQQLKWFAVAGALVLAQVVVTGFVREEQYPLALAIGFAILNWATYAAIGIAVPATACTTSTGCSTVRWSTDCSLPSWRWAMRPASWSSASSSGRTDPAWPSQAPPLPWRPCSSRCATACKTPSTDASTGAATTPPRPSRCSLPVSARRPTWTR
jgi:hypothetical protein